MGEFLTMKTVPLRWWQTCDLAHEMGHASPQDSTLAVEP